MAKGFKIDQGMLQISDLYNDSQGLNTKELTNPRLANDAEMSKDIMEDSASRFRFSPLLVVAIAVGVLLVVSHYQS